MEPRFDVSPRGGRRAARRGGGEGKVSRQPGAAPPSPPAPGAPRGFCRARPPMAAPRNAPARPGLAPAPARRAGAGALQRREPRSRRPPEPSPATLCGRNRGCRLGSSGGRTAKGLCGGKRQEEGKEWGKPLNQPQTSTPPKQSPPQLKPLPRVGRKGKGEANLCGAASAFFSPSARCPPRPHPSSLPVCRCGKDAGSAAPASSPAERSGGRAALRPQRRPAGRGRSRPGELPVTEPGSGTGGSALALPRARRGGAAGTLLADVSGTDK